MNKFINLRNALLSIGGIAAAGTALYLYGRQERKSVQLRRETLDLSKWPKSLDGYRIAVVGDFHLGTRDSMAYHGRWVMQQVLEERPDAIVLVGDIVDKWITSAWDYAAYALEPLQEAGVPILAVPGNHDVKGGDISKLKQLVESYGGHVLSNSSQLIDKVRFIGVESSSYHRHNLLEAFKEVDPEEPQIVLWHEPDLVAALHSGPALAISGHTHGGQVGLSQAWGRFGVRHGQKYPAGFHHTGNVPVYVTRGVGVSGLPIRIGRPPEIGLLTLNSASANLLAETTVDVRPPASNLE
jgi:hypothetical protein